MKRYRRLGASLLPLLLVMSAAGRHRAKSESGEKKALGKGAASQQVIKTPQVTEDAIYLIGPSDVLDVNVWKEKDLSQAVPVRADGKISLPLLGDVQAAGLTPMQLAASIAEKLEKYVTQPQVTVIVTAMNSRRVYVLGEVNRPGSVALLPNMTVLQAISSAGGPSQYANLKRIFVLRNENGGQTRYPFNYKDVIRGKALQQNFVLRPGDTIVVP